MMKTVKGIVLALVLLALAVGPLPVHAQTIVIGEAQRTGGLTAAPFGTIGGMLEVEPGVVLISDDVNKAVWRWQATSGRVSRFARDGRGPGEVTTPSVFATRPGGGFALYDVGLASVLFFDSARAFERTVRLQGGLVSNAKSMAVLADGSFVVSGGRLRDPRHLHRYTPAGKRIESFGDPSQDIVSDYAKIQPAATFKHSRVGCSSRTVHHFVFCEFRTTTCNPRYDYSKMHRSSRS